MHWNNKSSRGMINTKTGIATDITVVNVQAYLKEKHLTMHKNNHS